MVIRDPVWTSGPSTEPCDLTYVKLHTRTDGTADDTTLTSRITGARRLIERWSWRRFGSQIWVQAFDKFPCGTKPIVVPFGPLISVGSITYLDEDGASQTLSTDVYQVDTGTRQIVLKPNQVWPDTELDRIRAVTVTHTVGVTEAVALTEYSQAVCLLVSHWNEYREAVLSGSISKEIELAFGSIWPGLADWARFGACNSCGHWRAA